MPILLAGSRKWNCGRPMYVSRENAGAGSFLDPPFAKTHSWGIVEGYDRGNGYQGYMSVDYVLNDENVPASAKAQIRRIIGKVEKTDISAPEIQDWIRQVMGYFNTCYQGENGSWSASDLKIDKDADPIENQDKHAGVNLIRKHYPEFVLTEDILKGAYWGTKPEA